MDVDESSFYHLLPTILDDIGRSLFVAIDLELSGVPIKPSRVPGQSSGKQTLQQRYSEIKAAAEKYQILQIGLTFVRYDSETSTYICKPYNVPISPLVRDASLDIERTITFSSGAATFLRSVFFDFGKPFNDGVHYLRHDEAQFAYDKFDARQQRADKTTLDVKKTDLQAMAFLERTRTDVQHWLSSTQSNKDDWLNIGPPAFELPGTKPGKQPELSKYEKWLVHQLVQVEFPDLRTVSRRGFVQIVHHDKKSEARVLAEKRADLDLRLARQRGFTWVVDALLGNELPTEHLTTLINETTMSDEQQHDKRNTQGQIQTTCEPFLRRPSIIVGHNCFLDLVYFYHTFIGQLPESVQDFASVLHERCPLVIDTKYLATHNCGDIPPQSSLEELARRLEHADDDDDNDKSLDSIDPAHEKYNGTDFDFYHEAGFDSLLTAQVAIRLSRQLESAGRYLDDVEDGGVSVSHSGQTSSSYVSKAVDKSVNAISSTLSSLGLTSDKTASSADAVTGQPTSTETRSAAPLTTTVNTSHAGHLQREGSVPHFDSDFWRVYGNHLRVFGTHEGVLGLEPVLE